MAAYDLKDSGVDCLGKIPKHWGIGKIKNRFFLKPSNVDKKSYDNEIPVELCNYVDVYYNDFITNDLAFMSATATDYEINKFSLKVDDVIITKDSEDPMDIGIPALVKEIKPNLVCGYHLTMLRKRPCHVSGSFLFWALKDEAIASQLYREATGVTRWAISARNIKNVALAYPDLSEQKKIANYLEKACQNIDKTIAIKQQQLDKLEAYRKSVIHEAVTKGLDKTVEMKDSGVDWLGSIPTHWNIKRIKDIADLKSGNAITSLEIQSEGSYPVYGGNGLRGYTESYTHEGYKVLIGRQGDLCGNINYVNGMYFASEHAVVCNPFFYLNTFWFGELLRAMNLNQYSNAAAQAGLAVGKIKNLKIPFPTKDERIAIEIYLKNICERLDSTKVTMENQIKTLTQYRQSLIHECVTGKKRIYQGD